MHIILYSKGTYLFKITNKNQIKQYIFVNEINIDIFETQIS